MGNAKSASPVSVPNPRQIPSIWPPQFPVEMISKPMDSGAKILLELIKKKSIDEMNLLPNEVIQEICSFLTYLAVEDFYNVGDLKELDLARDAENGIEVKVMTDSTVPFNFFRRQVRNQRPWNYWSMASLGSFASPFAVEFMIRMNQFEGQETKITVVSAILRNIDHSRTRFAWMHWDEGFTTITNSRITVGSGWHQVKMEYFKTYFVIHESDGPPAVWQENHREPSRNVCIHFQSLSVGSLVSVDIGQVRVYNIQDQAPQK
jgi:hypothetical protein